MVSSQIEIAGTLRSGLKLCQERNYILNRIEHMTTDHDISGKVTWSIFPGSLYNAYVVQSLLTHILAQIVQHSSVWLNGSNMLHKWRQCQGKATCTRANIQYGCLRSNFASEPGKEGITGNGIPGCTMKPTCPAIPEICTGTTKTSISSVHLLRPCLEERIPTLNSCFHRDYPLPLPVSGACNLVLRQLKNCTASFSAVPCRRRAPTLAIVPLTLTVALQSICVWSPSRAVSCISPDISTALPGAFPRPFTTI